MNTNLCKIQMNLNPYSNSVRRLHREMKAGIQMISFFPNCTRPSVSVAV